MNFSDIAKQVATFAPGIAAAIGGPIGGVASMGMQALCGVLGLDGKEDDHEAIVAGLAKLGPAQATALTEVEQSFLKDMKRLDIDVFKLEVQDRQNARDREKTSGSLDNRILSYLMVAAFIGLVFSMVFYDGFTDMGTLQVSLVSTAVGIVSTKVNTVYEYYFGSSRGGAEASAALSKMVHK